MSDRRTFPSQQRFSVSLRREEWEALYNGARYGGLTVEQHNARAVALTAIRRKLQETT
jgi:hypothetical protein